MKKKKIKIKDLQPADYNPRTIDEQALEGLKASITRFGLVEPIIINERTGNIVGGHQRLKALQDLGEKETEVVVVDLDDQEERALNITLNNPAIQGDFTDGLQDLLADLDSSFPDFAELRLGDLQEWTPLDDEPGSGGDPGGDDLPKQVETRCKPGDVWILGDHRLLCGDANDTDSIERLLHGKRVAMIFTDPPYGIDLDTDFTSMDKGKKYKKVEGDDTPFDPSPLLEEFQDVPEIILWGADYYSERILHRNDGSFFVWDKTGGGAGPNSDYDKMFGSNFELAWSKKRHKRQILPILWKGIFGLAAEDTKKRIHPTQKPTALVSFFLSRFTKDGDLIFDPYAGSGSTLIAAESLSRSAYLVEIDPEYCDLIIARWEDYTGETARIQET